MRRGTTPCPLPRESTWISCLAVQFAGSSHPRSELSTGASIATTESLQW
ncbi:hypothetical protein CZ771_14680 [Actinomycetales bacterium JB111]|nr:hypothetical protein CZ771_14680 [Actinomycetales bacterium JB111]